MYNKVFIIGNLGSEPKLKYTQDGLPVAVLKIAVDDFVKRNGQYEKTTEWITVVAFGRTADFCSKLHKGDRVFVEGKLKTRTFEIESKVFKLIDVVAQKVIRISKPKETETGMALADSLAQEGGLIQDASQTIPYNGNGAVQHDPFAEEEDVFDTKKELSESEDTEGSVSKNGFEIDEEEEEEDVVF